MLLSVTVCFVQKQFLCQHYAATNMYVSCEGSNNNSPQEPLPTCNWPCNARAAGEILLPAFLHPDTGASKSIDCIWVDGAHDEGPSHEEVQYYWTERHLLKNEVAALVTTRSSGSSYLNCVELQNGSCDPEALSRAPKSTISSVKAVVFKWQRYHLKTWLQHQHLGPFMNLPMSMG